MVTWIFDLRALIIGFALGMFAGAFIFFVCLDERWRGLERRF